MAIAMISLGTALAQTPDRTAEVAGTVTTTGAPASPLARVLVTISGQTLSTSRTVVSDAQGHFTFRGLPSGSFTITAARAPFVTTAYGARRPGRPGTPVSVAAGQHIGEIAIRLAHGAAITGSVRDAEEDIVPGVRVEALPLDVRAGTSNPSAVTDDRGVYRIFGLPPGRFVVVANPSELASPQLTRRTDEEIDAIIANLQRRSPGGVAGAPLPGGRAPAGPGARPAPVERSGMFTYAPIYFPGTADPDEADPISMAEGEERNGVDIGLRLVRTATIEGHVSMPSGDVPAGLQLYLRKLGTRTEMRSIFSSLSSRRPDTTGGFRFPGVLPGRYRLVARTSGGMPVIVGGAVSGSGGAPTPGAGADALFAMADLDVSGGDLSGIDLVLQPGLKISGRVAFASGTIAPPRDLTPIRLRLTELTGASVPTPSSGAVRADGSFEIDGVLPGEYTVSASSVPAGWSLRSVLVGGQDVLDVPLEIASSDVRGVVATFTGAHTELSGSLQTAAGVPATDYFVVAFSPNRTFWRPASRRVLYTRPSTTGQFAFRDLPPGDYLLAALTDLEPTDLFDEAFLRQLVPGAVPVHLGEGEKKTQNVAIAR